MEKKTIVKKKSIKLDYYPEYKVFVIYAVTQVGFGKDGNPWYNIRGVCSTKKRAEIYKKGFEDQEKWMYGDDVKTMFDVECWELDHAHGANKWYFKKLEEDKAKC